MYEVWRCPAWSSHFQLVDLQFFRSSRPYHSYMDSIRPQIVSHGWGDDIIQSLFLRTDLHSKDIPYTAAERILCMQRWVPGYKHKGEGVTEGCDHHWPIPWHPRE